MLGAPIRAAIVVAAVVAGVLVITLGFSSAGAPVAAPSPGHTETPTPTQTSTPTNHKTTASGPKGHVQGVVLALFNTTPVVGLAACAATDLSQLGYVVPAANLKNAPPGSSTPKSVIFYRNAQGKADARLLAHRYFKDKDVKVSRLQSTADVPKGAQLVVFLGTRYAGTHQGGC